MTDEVGLDGVVEVFVPIRGDRFKAEACARDTADGSTRAVVVETDGNAVTDALGVIVSAENESEYDRAHIVDGVNGVHFAESLVEKLTCADVVCELAFIRKRPFKLLVKLGFLGNLLHAFLNSIERGFCGECRRNSSRTEHFAVDAVFAVSQERIVVGHFSGSLGIAGSGIAERVCADSGADPFNVVVEVCRTFGLGACLKLTERFFLCRAGVGKDILPDLRDIVQRVVLAVFFKKKQVEDDVGDIVVYGNLVDVLEQVVGSLIDTVVDLVGIIRARPVIDGRERHAVFECDCLHIGNGIHFDGNAEHASCETADQSALHAGFEIVDCFGCFSRAFGTKREDFVQFIGLKCVVVDVHNGLRSAVNDGFDFLFGKIG